jgi:drug/metabolite transporter (DMT)-like permease
MLYSDEWNPLVLEEKAWMSYSIIIAILFITLFVLIGRSAQLNGIASTSVAVKMSMAISLLFMIYIYSETLYPLKIIGIILAFIGVFLVTSSKQKNVKSAGWMLLLLFVGSGILDFTLNYVLKNVLGSMTPSLFSAFCFICAGIFGLVFIIVKIMRNSIKIEFKNIIAGIVLGIPNYFSIYLLLLSYQTLGWEDSTVLAITNVSIVLFSAIIGFIVFKENAGIRKIIGLVTAVLAITALYIAS